MNSEHLWVKKVHGDMEIFFAVYGLKTILDISFSRFSTTMIMNSVKFWFYNNRLYLKLISKGLFLLLKGSLFLIIFIFEQTRPRGYKTFFHAQLI